jgi:cytochrome c peroxidase
MILTGLGSKSANLQFLDTSDLQKEETTMSWSKSMWVLSVCGAAAVLLATLPGCQDAESSTDSADSAAASGDSCCDKDASGEPCCDDAADPAAGPATDPEVEPATQPVSTEAAPAGDATKVPLGLPPVPVPEDNPMTAEKIALGKLLYFDKRLSKDGTIACSTCHDPEMAWTEHEATSTGIGGQVGGANSPTVINAAYAKAQFWDGRAATLEEQALGPIENPIEMGHKLDDLVKELAEIPEYKEGFQKVFGTGVTKEGIAKAIAAFERTVLSGNSPYDQYKAGKEDALSEAQKRGMQLFEDLNCAMCHAPPLFSTYRYYNAGVGMDKEEPDEGRKAVTGRDRDLGKFRTPALREVANTGPYYHDGSIKTLEEAVALMARGGKDNPNLSPMFKALREEEVSEQDINDLVAFLKALSGDYPGKDG